MTYMNKNIIFEVIGWYGAMAILSAYILLSFDFVVSNSLVFQLLNLTGAFGLVFISVKKKNYQPAFLNIIWIIVAFLAIFKILI